VGDIIITKDSEDRLDIGVPACVRETAKDLVCGYHLTLLRAKLNVMSGDFLFWALQSKAVRDAFSNSAFGVTRYGLTLGGVKNIALTCPDLDTQKSIANFLDRETARIDQLSDKKKHLVDLLVDKEASEISGLVLRGSDNQAEMRESGLEWRGEVPAHWKQSRLKAQFRIQKRQGFENLTVLSVYREYGIIEKSSRDDNINKTPLDLSTYQLVMPGDIVINKMKAWQGSLGISRYKGITSPDYVVMTPVGEHFSTYIHYLLRARPMPSVYHTISNGIRIDQWRMEPDRFLKLPVFLPPQSEQMRIAETIEQRVDQLRKLAEITTTSISRLSEFRAALISAAVTGHIDVQNWGKYGETDRRLDAIGEEMGTLRATEQVEARA
jgi:type I restriction enzyme S subunit